MILKKINLTTKLSINFLYCKFKIDLKYKLNKKENNSSTWLAVFLITTRFIEIKILIPRLIKLVKNRNRKPEKYTKKISGVFSRIYLFGNFKTIVLKKSDKIIFPQIKGQILKITYLKNKTKISH